MQSNNFELLPEAISSELQFSQIILNDDYVKKWNVSCNDYFCLTKNGILVSSNLYRKGGMGGDFKDGYALILKYVEAIYDDVITKIQKRKRHLKSVWVIIDKNGVEKYESQPYDSIFLQGGLIFCNGNKYYNIETGELYCQSYTTIKSEDYVFLNNPYDDDKSRRGVMKINKRDGSYEIFK
ncbi:MAG: hypothetical protein V4547_18280 [Bacteroidota bacterium]